jgi:hypothetical protein
MFADYLDNLSRYSDSSSRYLAIGDRRREQGGERFIEEVGFEGHLRDRRFNAVLQQGLGKVAESLAKRLLTVDGFVVKDFSFNVSPYVAGMRYAGGMSAQSWRGSRRGWCSETKARLLVNHYSFALFRDRIVAITETTIASMETPNAT